MSTSVESADKASFQPFQCTVCQRRFTRHENLKRHAALHSRSHNDAALSCDSCPATFSRADLKRRHIKRKHPELEEEHSSKKARAPATSEHDESQLPVDQRSITTGHNLHQTERVYDKEPWDHGASCDYTRSDNDRQISDDYALEPTLSSLAASAQEPLPTMWTNRSQSSGRVDEGDTDIARLEFSISHPFGSPTFSSGSGIHQTNGLQTQISQHIPDGLSPNDLPYLQENWHPTYQQISYGTQLFFRHVSTFTPFLHHPTFDASSRPRNLVLSMLSLAYHYGEDPDAGGQLGSGLNLAVHCFHRARVLTISSEESLDTLSEVASTVQAYLLLQICAMMYLCGKDSSYALKMHSRMVSAARSGGLMQPHHGHPQSIMSDDLNALWIDFIASESYKRTVFAIHQLDALWYQLLSVPRLLSHLEIKHDLPCPVHSWSAESSAAWAHRQLTTQQSQLLPYAEAVRAFLAPEPDLSLALFDPYGAVNITQFLISSAREISGWSTMTGRLSMERFDPLRSALTALEPFIRSNITDNNTTPAPLCEATWEMAMVELQIWSPSHTGGIVAGSVDSVVSQAAFLAPTAEFLIESDTAKAVQAHVDWFLRYLDSTASPDSEAPWVALYAYKVFLIAWTLVKEGVDGAMTAVGVGTGDVAGARAWAARVFGRRSNLRMGEMIVTCIEKLST